MRHTSHFYYNTTDDSNEFNAARYAPHANEGTAVIRVPVRASSAHTSFVRHAARLQRIGVFVRIGQQATPPPSGTGDGQWIADPAQVLQLHFAFGWKQVDPCEPVVSDRRRQEPQNRKGPTEGLGEIVHDASVDAIRLLFEPLDPRLVRKDGRDLLRAHREGEEAKQNGLQQQQYHQYELPSSLRAGPPMVPTPPTVMRTRVVGTGGLRMGDLAVMAGVPDRIHATGDQQHDRVQGEERRVKGEEHEVLLVIGTDAAIQARAQNEWARSEAARISADALASLCTEACGDAAAQWGTRARAHQLLTHGQWWSIFIMQRSHCEQ